MHRNLFSLFNRLIWRGGRARRRTGALLLSVCTANYNVYSSGLADDKKWVLRAFIIKHPLIVPLLLFCPFQGDIPEALPETGPHTVCHRSIPR